MDLKLFKEIALSFEAEITEIVFTSKYGEIKGYHFQKFITSDDLVEMAEYKIKRVEDFFCFLVIPEIDELNQKFRNAGDDGLPFVFIYIDKGYADITLSAWNILEPIQKEITFDADKKHGFSLLCYLKSEEMDVNFISYDPEGEYPDYDIELIINFGVEELDRMMKCN